MGKKKSKEQDSSQAGGEPSPPQSDIFKSLFGIAEEQNTAASSLFSDKNPFRRKNQEEAPPQLDSDAPILKKKKKEKGKRKDENPNSIPNGEEEEAVAPLVAKKKKKEKSLESESESKSSILATNVESEGGEEAKVTSLGIDAAPESPGSEKKKKKRKRDELERGYEEKKYGTTPEEEGGVIGKVTGKKRKNVDDAAVDALVPKEGFDDETKLLRTVFVGNLPLKIKKKLLMKEFSKFGEVESVRIRSIPLTDTKIPRKGAIMQKKINENADSVHAYVVFKAEESAEASLAHNMAVVAGNHIRVDRACPPRKKLKVDNTTLYDNKRTVFVGNLPFDVKDEEIYQLFCSIKDIESSIEAVRVIRDPHVGVGKGIAYVLFKTREAANLVLRKRTLKLRDRELRLSHAKADATPSKRKNPSGAETAYSPAKRFAPDSANKSNTKPSMSYQGMRANKSDTNKKVHSAINVAANSRFTPARGGKPPKERSGKRPSVAARKAKANAKAGGSQQPGVKRKLDSRSPGSSHQKKAKRRFG